MHIFSHESDLDHLLIPFLLSYTAVLKDVRNSPLEMIKDPDMDQTRMSSYPNLEYCNLYNAICMLVSIYYGDYGHDGWTNVVFVYSSRLMLHLIFNMEYNVSLICGFVFKFI